MYLDRNARELVLRFAYAGQPLSGKTRSLRALLPLLKGAASAEPVLSPHEEHGRTWYFDWACYRGGSVQGNAVHCQIVTVPGQEALAQRRQWLIESADVVIFVVDSDPQQLLQAQRSYHELLPWLARAGRAPIPVIFQCNKRDLPSAAPLERIRQQLGLDAQSPLFESTAVSGRGIRLAFVAALRAAAQQIGTLPGLPTRADATRIDSAEQLLELIQRLEFEATTPVSAAARTTEAAARAVPAPPSAERPAGTIATANPVAESPTPPRATAAPGRAAAERTLTELPGRNEEPASRVAAMRVPPPAVAATPPVAAQPTRLPDAASEVATVPSPPSAAATPHAPAIRPPTPELLDRTDGVPSEVAATPQLVHQPVEPAQASSRDGSRDEPRDGLRPATIGAPETARHALSEPLRKPALPRWSGQGPRPAIMPAADWRALVLANGQVLVPRPAARPSSAPGPVAASRAAAQLEATASAQPPTTPLPIAVPKQRAASPLIFQSASARPAVMPMAAWRSWLQARESNAPVEPPRPMPPPIESIAIADEETPAAPIRDEVDSVLLPLGDQPLANVWPVATWQWLSPQFHRQPKAAACENGVWSGEVAPSWLAASAALFGDHETGIEALGLEVQRRERLRQYLWPHRCLVLCSDGGGYWRLWELVRSATTLEQILRRILAGSAQGRAEQTAGNLVMLGRAYLKALDSLPQASEPLAVDFSTVAQHEGRLVYAGWLHTPTLENAPRRPEPIASLAGQLRLHFPVELPATIDVHEICSELQRLEPDGAHQQIAELFAGMLLRYAQASHGRDISVGARH